MINYSVHYVHKISPSDNAVGPDVYIPSKAFSDCNTLGRVMRDRGLLIKGQRLRAFRVEGDKVICFPVSLLWHSIVLTAHKSEG